MIRFTTSQTPPQPLNPETEDPRALVYIEADHSFLARGMVHGPYAVLVNDLELSITSEGEVVGADGYAPREAWQPTTAAPPPAARGQVRVEGLPPNIGAGMSVRLTSPSEWPTYFNTEAGWLCIGKPQSPDGAQAIRIDAGVVLVIQGQELASIWLPVNFEAGRVG